MTYCQSIIKILIIIWVRCIPLSLRSKTRQWATPLLLTWIYSCRSGGTISGAFLLRQTWRFQIWILKNSKESLKHLKSTNSNFIISIKSFDFRPFTLPFLTRYFKTVSQLSYGTLSFTKMEIADVLVLGRKELCFIKEQSHNLSIPLTGYGVYISQHIKYSGVSTAYECLILRAAQLSFKNWMLILVLLCENERQRWDASRYIKARSEAQRFYVYRDASHLWRSFSHNRTIILHSKLIITDIAILVCPRKLRIIFPLAE